MVSLSSFAAKGATTAEALSGLRIDDLSSASMLFAFYGCAHDGDQIKAFLTDKFPDIPFMGGTSCSGFMTDAGLWGPDSLGLLVINDADGEYGVAAADVGEDAAATAAKLLEDALVNAGCPGELPELIWVYQVPGFEEEVIAGLRQVVGDRCPVIGGSAADNTVDGHWQQIAPTGLFTDGLVIGVLFPSGGIGYAFQGGYEPAGPQGIITQSQGREIQAIDGKPAAAVYNEWIGGILDDKVTTGGNILLETTMSPLAVNAGDVGGVPQYLLIHPDAITDKGALSTFANVETGTRLFSMTGNKDRLVERAGRVASEAAAGLPDGAENLAGSLIVYCAGCMLAVDDRLDDVVQEVSRTLGDTPFLGCFTFGEQGALIDKTVHGNLMISAVAFGR